MINVALNELLPFLEPVDAGLSIGGRVLCFLEKFRPSFSYRNDYYFEEVNKKVFIKKNGDGMVICAFDLFVIRPNKVEDFVRGIDISDAKKNTKFPSFRTMRKKKLNFFSDYGFWYESEQNIITSVEECYDDPTLSELKNTPVGKRLGVKFLIDKNKLQPKHKYRVVYAYSIPGLYPVKEGKHDREEYNYKNYGKHQSSMNVRHTSKRLKFAIYLENGFQLKAVPLGHAIKQRTNKKIDPDVCVVRNNILYTKYLYELKNPEKYAKIYIDWQPK